MAEKIPLIFDNENVIVHSSWENIAARIPERFQVPRESATACKQRFHCSREQPAGDSAINDAVSGCPEYAYPHDSLLWAYSRGLISGDDYYSRVLAQGYHLSPTSDAINAMAEIMGSMTTCACSEVIALIKKAKVHGHPLFMISNSNPDVEYHNRSRYDYFGLFDRIIMSHHVQLRKPDPRIYALVPKGIFIDDKLENTTAAKIAGHRSIRYHIDEPAGVLNSRLKDYGVAL